MSSEPNMPNDEEVDAFLRGKYAVSQRYRELPQAQPPAELDAAVLALAQQALRKPRAVRRWRVPMALAASLIVGFGLTLSLWREPAVRTPQASPAAAPLAPQAVEGKVDSVESAEPVASDLAMRAQAETLPPAMSTAPRSVAPKMEAKAKESKQTGALPVPAPSAPSGTVAPRDPLPSPPPEPQKREVQAPPSPSAPVEASPDAAVPVAAAEMVQPSSPPAMPSQPRPSTASRVAAENRPDASAGMRSRALMSAFATHESEAQAVSVWSPGVFEGLKLGEARREDVIARFGEPDSSGLSAPGDARASEQRSLRFDVYSRIPGVEGLVEFYYAPSAQDVLLQQLVTVRVVPLEPVPLQRFVSQLGWAEPPRFQSWSEPPCEQPWGDETERGVAQTEAPRYGIYPQRGVYLLLLDNDTVEQLIYEAQCDLGP